MNMKLLIPLMIAIIFFSRFEQYSQENLIYNGNFSLGNVGFSTDYIYSSGSPFGQGYYTIGTNPQTVHPGFAPCKDHTQDSAMLMLFFDSYTVPGKLVWSQIVNITESSVYQFSMWATKLVYYNDSYLQVKINGEDLSPTFHVSKTPCTWSFYDVKWNSGNATKALIEIYNLSTFAAGNDLAIDDIEFIILNSDCLVKLNLGDDLGKCLGDIVLLGNENGQRNELDFIWSPNQYLDNPYAGNPRCFALTDITYYVKAVNNTDGCIAYDTINVYVRRPNHIEIAASSLFLCDKSVNLTASEGFTNYFWSNGDSGRVISVYHPGLYIVSAFDENGCLSVAEIIISDDTVNVQIPEVTDLGVVCLGFEIQDSIRLTNLSNSSIIISEISYLVDSDDFFIDFSHLIGKEILPLDIDYLIVNVKPKTMGRHFISLRVKIDYPCVKFYDIIIIIQSDVPIIHLSVPDTSVNIGDVVCLPIMGHLSCIRIGFPISYKLNIKINKLIFNPLYTTSGSIISIKDDDKYNLIEIEDFQIWLTDKKEIINHICGLIMLGDKLFDQVYLTDMHSYNGFNHVLYNGSIISNACAFQIRPVQIFQKTQMNIKENPAYDNLEITVLSSEQGNFRFEIFDILGNQVFVNTWQNDNILYIDFPIRIATSSLNQGLYQVVLSTPWNTLKEKLIILK